jgi:hypothetical protein
MLRNEGLLLDIFGFTATHLIAIVIFYSFINKRKELRERNGLEKMDGMFRLQRRREEGICSLCLLMTAWKWEMLGCSHMLLTMTAAIIILEPSLSQFSTRKEREIC